jgi:hypothetical protein
MMSRFEADYTSVAEKDDQPKLIRRSKMIKSGFSYLKLTGSVAALAITLIGLRSAAIGGRTGNRI